MPLMLTDYATQRYGNSVLNLVTDFGGSFEAWNAFYAQQSAPVTLIIPSGTYGTGYPNTPFLAGVGPGCTIIGGNPRPEITVAIVYLGDDPSPPFANAQPKFHSVSAGASSITLVTPADTSAFTVGKWVILMCLDLQGSGFPQNNYFFEYKRVSAINSMTGVISFDEPLVENYVETYPVSANTGTPFFPDEAGIPTVMPMPDSWDQEITLKNIKFMNTGAQPLFGTCRKLVFDNCVFTGANPAPSVSVSQIFRNCDITGTGTEMEIDKDVEYLEFNNCTIRKATEQSTNIKETVVTDCTITESWHGTGKEATFTNCTIAAMSSGPLGYGSSSDQVTLTNCNVSSFAPVISGNMLLSQFTRSGNELRIQKNTGVFATGYDFAYQAFLVPGHWFQLNVSSGLGFGNAVGPTFQITDVYEDGTDVVVVTTLPAGAIPQLTAVPPPTVIVSLSTPSLTVSNCTGSAAMRILSRAAPNTPFGTYYHSGTMNGATQGAQDGMPTPGIMGNIVSLTIDVATAYTGVQGTLTFNPTGQFGMIGFYDDTYNTTNLNPSINLKIAGTRVITPAGVTGAQAGDTNLTLPGSTNNYLTGHVTGAYFPTDISGESSAVYPSVTVELITDLGIT